VSTIIECPACATRYKMNKAIPEGGRPVKCARCGNQWRLLPEGYVDETLELETDEHNSVAPQSPPEHSREASPDEDAEPSVGAPEVPAFASRPTGRDPFASAISTPSEPQTVNYGEAAAQSEDEPVGRDRWRDFEAAEPASSHTSDADPDVSQGVDRLAAAPAADEDEDNAAQDPADQPDESWSARMNRPWRDFVAASRVSAEEEDENTENEIRNALKAALENQVDDALRAGPFQEQLRSQHQDARSEAGWGNFLPDRAGGPLREESEARDAADADHAGQPFSIPGHDPAADPEPEDEAPFKLTGNAARRPIYQAEEATAGEGEDDDNEAGGEAATLSAGFRSDIEDAFRAPPLPKWSYEPAPRRHDESLTDFDRLYDEHTAGGPAGSGFYDENAAAAVLQAELESTDLAAYEPRPSGGGLAVAAAWAVFFSIISGVALAMVTLRSEIMATLPGTTSLYRALGFDVAESGIDFADVSYRWTVTEGKPMIEVKGQVVNITDRRLTVPRVLINVRDGQSSDPVKVTASVPTESLAPRESASFTLEFVSPPKNISQIELEFDRNR
jgi:predicted Zn finger-like uncharacterized protein